MKIVIHEEHSELHNADFSIVLEQSDANNMWYFYTYIVINGILDCGEHSSHHEALSEIHYAKEEIECAMLVKN